MSSTIFLSFSLPGDDRPLLCLYYLHLQSNKKDFISIFSIISIISIIVLLTRRYRLYPTLYFYQKVFDIWRKFMTTMQILYTNYNFRPKSS